MVAYRTELMLAWGAALVMRECYMCIRAFWMLASKMTSFVPFCLPHATTREQNSHGNCGCSSDVKYKYKYKYNIVIYWQETIGYLT